MIILGFLGSPRLNGKCSQLLQHALDGAAGSGATTKRIDLIKKDIRHCLGCCRCLFDDPALPIGRCPLKDDMAAMLAEYQQADGYLFASPVYDVSVSALMKKFLERKIALTHRPQDAYATIGSPRVSADFKKSATMIVTGNCSEEYRELMADPCFEMMAGHLIVEQVNTTDKLYVGGVENMTEQAFLEKCAVAHQMGARLVSDIMQSRSKN